MDDHPEQHLTFYLVGGAVRDRLLGLSGSDRDFVVIGSCPSQMIALGFKPVGKDFPVFLHPHTHEEYALARIERKVEMGHQGFAFQFSQTVTLEEDLKRRDLTINAIAMTSQGEYIDPYQGIKDLEHKILRHVSGAFSEDPLRVLRVARFAARFFALGFTIAPETLNLMRTISRQAELCTLSSERIWREIQLALATDHPAVFMHTLLEVGAFQALFPGVKALPDSTIESMQAHLVLASRCKASPKVRFAAWMAPLADFSIQGRRFYQEFCTRAKPPSAWIELAGLIIQELHFLRQINLKTAEEIVQFFQRVDAYRRSDRFLTLLEIAKINMQDLNYALLVQGFEKTNQVKAQPFIEEGQQGLALKQAILKERIKIIKIILCKFL